MELKCEVFCKIKWQWKITKMLHFSDVLWDYINCFWACLWWTSRSGAAAGMFNNPTTLSCCGCPRQPSPDRSGSWTRQLFRCTGQTQWANSSAHVLLLSWVSLGLGWWWWWGWGWVGVEAWGNLTLAAPVSCWRCEWRWVEAGLEGRMWQRQRSEQMEAQRWTSVLWPLSGQVASKLCFIKILQEDKERLI